jgi:hypothetical protein
MRTVQRDSHDRKKFVSARSQAAEVDGARPARRFTYSSTNGWQNRSTRGSTRTNRLGSFYRRWTGRFQ